MGTRFVAERAEPEHGTEHRKMPFVQLFSVQWNTSKFSEHMDGYWLRACLLVFGLVSRVLRAMLSVAARVGWFVAAR